MIDVVVVSGFSSRGCSCLCIVYVLSVCFLSSGCYYDFENFSGECYWDYFLLFVYDFVDLDLVDVLMFDLYGGVFFK